MKTILLTLTLTLAAAAHAQDFAWVLDDKSTPRSLVEQGAVLLEKDSIAWPDGGAVELTYWEGTAANIYRCAELRSGETPKTACWLRVAAEPDARSEAAARVYRTERRPPVATDAGQVPIYPHVWLRGDRYLK